MENRYLCVFEFSDSQLERYVRLSGPCGAFVDIANTKETIKRIQQDYLTEDFDVYSQDLQARILTTTPNSIDPYISYILGPSEVLEDMKREISELTKGKGKRKSKKFKKSKRKSKTRIRKFHKY